MRIVSDTIRASVRGPAAWFTGVVWIDEIVNGESPSRLKAIRVTFEPGARTAWHFHPVGQTLHVLSGVGRVQQEGHEPQEIRAGDTVYIEPGEMHWHGAAPGHTMVHLAMYERDDESGTDAVWREHVSDEEYEAVPVLAYSCTPAPDNLGFDRVNPFLETLGHRERKRVLRP